MTAVFRSGDIFMRQYGRRQVGEIWYITLQFRKNLFQIGLPGMGVNEDFRFEKVVAASRTGEFYPFNYCFKFLYFDAPGCKGKLFKCTGDIIQSLLKPGIHETGKTKPACKAEMTYVHAA